MRSNTTKKGNLRACHQISLHSGWLWDGIIELGEESYGWKSGMYDDKDFANQQV